jgi:hypothetical protein
MDKETLLENGLVKFVEEHSETFTDVSSIRRSIIRAFATFQFHRQFGGILRVQQHYTRPGLKPLAIAILEIIVDKMERYSKTSQDVRNILDNFRLCVEFIETFVSVKDGLCAHEMTHNGLGGEVSGAQPCIDFMNSLVIPPRPLRVFLSGLNINHAIWTNSKMRINYYLSRVLKLWADILINEEIIKKDRINIMSQRMSPPAATSSGSTQPMRIDGFGRTVPMTAAEAAKAAIVATFGNPATMSLETLLNVLTFIHLTDYGDQMQMDLFLTHGDGLLVNRFVELKNVRGIGNSFIGSHVPNELDDELQLKCNVVGNADPVQAYLSSDILDRCVESIGGFPTTRQFVEFLNLARQRKAEQFLKKDSDVSTLTVTSSFGGGKKTIHKIKKRNKKSNKKRSQRSHYH